MVVLAIVAPPVDDRVSPDAMSERDRAHWHAVQDWRARTLAEPAPPSAVGRLLGTGARWLPWVVSGVRDAVHGAVDTALAAVVGSATRSAVHRVAGTALGLGDRLGEVGTRLGCAGVGPDAVLDGLRRAGHDVDALADLAGLEVDDLLDARSTPTRAYVALAAVHGGTSALVVGAGTHGSALVGLAAPIVGGSADTVLTVAVCMRAIARVGAGYGYDTTDPLAGGRERAVALAVLAVALAPAAERRSADAVARDAADGHPVPPRLARDVADRVRARRPGQDVARIVPALGAGVGAVGAARLLLAVVEDADHLYRERFLREKYRGTEPVALAA